MSHRPYPHRQRALHQIQRHPAPALADRLGGITSAAAAANIAAFVATMQSYATIDAMYASRPTPALAKRVRQALLDVSSTVARSIAWPAGAVQREQAR
jgi:hypothetical protein